MSHSICLTYFTWHNALQVHSCSANGKISFFLWLSNIPFCICMYVCVHVNITSSLSSHLLVDTGSFRILATVSHAAVNSGVHASFQVNFFSGYMSRSGADGSHGNSSFSLFFKQTPYCFPQWLHRFAVSADNVGEFPFRMWRSWSPCALRECKVVQPLWKMVWWLLKTLFSCPWRVEWAENQTRNWIIRVAELQRRLYAQP